MSLKARLVSIRRLPAGTTVGYACTERLERDTLVGTVSAGYADGCHWHCRVAGVCSSEDNAVESWVGFLWTT